MNQLPLLCILILLFGGVNIRTWDEFEMRNPCNLNGKQKLPYFPGKWKTVMTGVFWGTASHNVFPTVLFSTLCSVSYGIFFSLMAYIIFNLFLDFKI
jgi:hypothetical protein